MSISFRLECKFHGARYEASRLLPYSGFPAHLSSSEDARLHPRQADSKNSRWFSRISLSAAGVWNNFRRTSSDFSSAVKHFAHPKARTDVADTISVCAATQVHVRRSCDSPFHLRNLPLFAKFACRRNLETGGFDPQTLPWLSHCIDRQQCAQLIIAL